MRARANTRVKEWVSLLYNYVFMPTKKILISAPVFFAVLCLAVADAKAKESVS